MADANYVTVAPHNPNGPICTAASMHVAASIPNFVIMEEGSKEPPEYKDIFVDGWKATQRLKGNPQTRDIPIIALSAHALAGEREKALAAGCNEFDTKPIEFDRLVAILRRILASLK